MLYESPEKIWAFQMLGPILGDLCNGVSESLLLSFLCGIKVGAPAFKVLMSQTLMCSRSQELSKQLRDSESVGLCEAWDSDL